ncbi:MAG TPA: hypothetical protein VE644_12590 [Gaiellaceae bacterium]|nr:hypothetical protein [Gaiellaceae bacterium]
MRRRAWVAVVLGALLLTVTPAGAQVTLSGVEDTVEGTVDTVDSTATDVGDAVEDTVGAVDSSTPDVGDTAEGAVDTVGSTAGQVADTADSTAGQAAGTVQGAAAGATGSSGTSALPLVGGTSGGSGSTAGGGSTSSGSTSSGSGGTRSANSRSGSGREAGSRGTRHRTKFDRLPPRFERLLERIEFGRNVRANIRKLEQLLASASPALRARILRLVQAEIRRLRRDGVTRAERSRIERLQLVKRALRGSAPTTARTSSGSAPPLASAAWRGAEGSVLTPAGPRPTGEGGVLADRAAGGRLGAETGDGDREAGAGSGPLPSVPAILDPPDEFPFTIGLILLVLAGLGLAGVVATVTARVLGRARSS